MLFDGNLRGGGVLLAYKPNVHRCMSEKFNPSDSQYKRVEDLPQAEQEKFINFGNGFVGKRANEEHEESMVTEDFVKSENRKKLSAAELQELIAKNELIAEVEGGMDFLLKEDKYKTGSIYSLYERNGLWVADINIGYVNYDSSSIVNKPERSDFESEEEYDLAMGEYVEYENDIYQRGRLYEARVENFLDTVRKNPNAFPLEVCLAARVELDEGYPRAYGYNIGSHELSFSVARNYTSDGHGVPIKAYGYEISTDSQVIDVHGNPVHAYDERPVTDSQLVEKSNHEYGRLPHEETLVVQEIEYEWKGGSYLVVDYIKLRDDARHIYVRSYGDLDKSEELCAMLQKDHRVIGTESEYTIPV